MENTVTNSSICQPAAGSVCNDVYSEAVYLARQLDPEFTVDAELKPAMRSLVLYFANDIRFEKEGFGKLNKGLFISGNVGVGKTLIMKGFATNPKKHYVLKSSNIITHEYMKEGIEGIERYMGLRNMSAITAYCFDDIGSEPAAAKYMGTELNVIAEIIISRYERGVPFHFTHFTSNLDAKAIEIKYGSRVRSRLRETCNFIVIDGNDRRK